MYAATLALWTHKGTGRLGEDGSCHINILTAAILTAIVRFSELFPCPTRAAVKQRSLTITSHGSVY